MPSPSLCSRWLAVPLALAFCATTVQSFSSAVARGPRPIILYAASSDGDDASAAVDGGDGSSTLPDPQDLTDRFKYKVHALMGSFDPAPGTVDDENQTGNILGAMLNFPAEYTFSVVGKTGGEDVPDSAGDDYADEVKSVLSSVLGSDAKVEMRVVPRGTKFTRVSAKVTVESASIISSIYEELDALEATVMKF